MFGGSDSSDGGADFDRDAYHHPQQQHHHHHRHQRSVRTDQRPSPGGGGAGGGNVGRDYHHPPHETRHFRSGGGGGGGGGSGGADSDISGLGSDLAGPGQPGEQELASKMLQIQSKRFYLDVKQNRRGRFIKVAEIGADGRRSQIFLALSTAAEFRGHLSSFSDFYASLGPPNPDNLPEDGKLKSEMMTKDNRRYYLDLKENSRGRFLRVSQTIARGGPRSQIAIPAQGMIEFRDALTDLLEEFGTDDGGFKGELPEGRHLRVENKNFYFDIGQNNRGIYMRISEVKTNYRTAVTIPEKSWSRFRDIFSDYVDKMKDGGSNGGGGGASAGGAGAAAVTPTSSSVAADSSPGPSSVSHKK